MERGVFTISLDFELAWGMEEKPLSPSFQQKMLWEVQKGIPTMLELFKKHKIHATWATVGLLFSGNGKEDPLRYAMTSIKSILSCPNQEIGTHTFTHYCCLADGQDKDDFASDLKNAVGIARRNGIKIKSIVFPHNQVNEEYLQICQKEGITAFRGNPQSWMYEARKGGKEPLFCRLGRLADSYINISGHNAFDLKKPSAGILNIPASRFFRPYDRFLAFFEPLKLRRILSDMKYAAKNNLVYHLWWHPYNLGAGREFKKNVQFLREILSYFSELSLKYGMESLNMGELTNKVTAND